MKIEGSLVHRDEIVSLLPILFCLRFKINSKILYICEFQMLYSTPHSDFIFILNVEVKILILLDTNNLAVSQLPYE